MSETPSENVRSRQTEVGAAGKEWLVGGGEMGELIRSMDWSQTPLGPLESWPNNLRTTVSLCLSSNFPINIVWGPDYVQIYNDGYRVIVGERHPEGMGMAYNVCWASAWPAVGAPFERAWDGDTSFLENQRMFLTRSGYLEETFFTFSLSPIRNEHGVISGLFHPVTETTLTMLSERRTRALRELAENTNEARSLEVAFDATARSLGAHELDLPFILLYSVAHDAEEARLISYTGIEPELDPSPAFVDLREHGADPWEIRKILNTETMQEIAGLHDRFGEFSCGPYPEGANRAIVRVLRVPGIEAPLGIIVAGVSPRLPYNRAYRDHLEQVTTAAATALGNALAYEQERKRSEALAAIDHAKTQFFANVSHEFRTPLALMLGPVEAVLATGSGELSDENREQIQIARRNSLRLLKLVNNLLDFSRIEAGRAQASFEPTDLSILTEELASSFRSAVESAGMVFVVHCPALPEQVYVDREMWEKIVLNLVSNAFKFTLQGRIEVRMSSEAQAVRLEVADTGAGISPDQIDRVFERFHRVEGQQGRTHEGSGIGLALVNEFTRLHGGAVSVKSQVGEGSIFTVRIPLGRAHLPQERLRASEEARRSAVRPESYTEEASRWSHAAQKRKAGVPGSEASPQLPQDQRLFHLLLAEDNADMRDYILRVLGPAYQVETVSDGEEALEAISVRRPDLVLSDVMMPRIDGIAMLQAVRRNPATRSLPVILVSARAGEEAKAEGIELGADDYLVKPFSPRELKARVHTHLELGALRNEIAAARESLRTAELLRESEKLAVVGRLASSIAHEINNPLEAVTNLLYLVGTSNDLTAVAGYAKTAQQELARVSNITTQTLRFHRQSTKRQDTAVTELLESVLTLFAGRVLNAGVTVERQFRTEGRIRCLAGDLRQVFANLVANALDASRVGGCLILRVSSAKAPRTGERGIRVSVADTGQGMPDHVRRRIYEPFFTTKETTGTGLGLWVSSEILSNHQATISVRSCQAEHRSGTVFSIFFPDIDTADTGPKRSERMATGSPASR